MRVDKETWEKELEILFGALCDGLRQEVRHRSLMQLIAPDEGMSLVGEREAQVKASLFLHLRIAGFLTHLESRFYEQPAQRRPDFAVFLPASKRYLFLECKVIDPYSGYQKALGDIDKLARLDKAASTQDRKNGLVCLGFRDREKKRDGFVEKYDRLSRDITSKYRYRKVGIGKIDLNGLDGDVPYAMLGLWVHKLR